MREIHKTLIRFILLNLVMLCIPSGSAFAQLPNGSMADSEYITFLEANLGADTSMVIDTSNPELTVNLSLEVFVVNDSLGNANFDTLALTFALPVVNSYFRNIGIQFSIGGVHEVKEYAYAHITHQDSTREMETRYAKQNRISLFVVDSIELDDVHYMGFSFFPDDTSRNTLFICKSEVSGNNLAALLGSFFGLLRTQENAGGGELVSGENCATSGDYICDTYADGGMFGLVDPECLYKGALTDSEGEYYIPSVANVMADSPDVCRCLFSLEQYRRMKYYYLNYRQYLR